VQTGFTQEAIAGSDGFYRLLLLPVGEYTITVDAAQFATLVRDGIQVNLSQTLRLNLQMDVTSVAETVTVEGGAQLVDTTTNALGRVVTGRELVDLPLNGRNFTQLGLLQTGVAPLTAGVATAGGSLRQGQAYAVNGMRPESNMYLVDGGQNLNRMDGGYALKLPVEAIAEFRILTQSAPPEYGGTGGATTSVVTRSGTNQFHGNLYEFVRNDAFDARNFFSEGVEPLKQNQFGGTIGGPIAQNRVLFFGYYEGFRNKQGYTTTATVPSDRQRTGDFSDLGTPLIFGLTTYNHSPSDLKHYCMCRNNVANLRAYAGVLGVLAFVAKTFWFYLFTRRDVGRLRMSLGAMLAGWRGDFTGHRKYLA
jgi:hypothetical protein